MSNEDWRLFGNGVFLGVMIFVYILIIRGAFV